MNKHISSSTSASKIVKPYIVKQYEDFEVRQIKGAIRKALEHGVNTRFIHSATINSKSQRTVENIVPVLNYILQYIIEEDKESLEFHKPPRTVFAEKRGAHSLVSYIGKGEYDYKSHPIQLLKDLDVYEEYCSLPRLKQPEEMSPQTNNKETQALIEAIRIAHPMIESHEAFDLPKVNEFEIIQGTNVRLSEYARPMTKKHGSELIKLVQRYFKESQALIEAIRIAHPMIKSHEKFDLPKVNEFKVKQGTIVGLSEHVRPMTKRHGSELIHLVQIQFQEIMSMKPIK